MSHQGLRMQLLLGRRGLIALFLFVLSASPRAAGAADRLCDTAFENCRTPVLELIEHETVGIDVGFWFMEDTRYASALIDRWRAGVPVRVVFDTRAISQYGYDNAAVPGGWCGSLRGRPAPHGRPGSSRA